MQLRTRLYLNRETLALLQEDESSAVYAACRRTPGGETQQRVTQCMLNPQSGKTPMCASLTIRTAPSNNVKENCS